MDQRTSYKRRLPWVGRVLAAGSGPSAPDRTYSLAASVRTTFGLPASVKTNPTVPASVRTSFCPEAHE